MPTIADVAARAGVGLGTVSRVLNGSTKVRDGTRARVQAAIDQLGYRPNPLARGLSRGRCQTLGVMVPFFTHASAVERLRGVVAGLDGSRYDLVLFNVEAPLHREEHLASLNGPGRADGLLILSMPVRARDLARLADAGIAVVLVDANGRGVPCVVTDDVAGGRLATQHLVDLGHRRIAFVGGEPRNPLGFSSGRAREQGYEAVLRAARLSVAPRLRRYGPHERESARALARELLEPARHRPTAVFASSDVQAIGVLAAAADLGLRVPDDLSVVGFDDIELSAHVGLTTVRQPLFDSGRLGVELLLQALGPAAPPPRRHEPPSCPSSSWPAPPPARPAGHRPEEQPTGDMRMTRHRTRWLRASLALLLPFSLIAAACAGDDDDEGAQTDDTSTDGADLSGTTVTIFGPEVEVEAQGFLDSFAALEEETGIDVQYQGDRSFEEQIGVRVDGGDPPDIAMFPQPGKIADFTEELVPLSEDLRGLVEENFDEGWTELVTIDDELYAVPAKADLKSLVWYDPQVFEESGYTIPTTFQEFLDLTDQIMADGKVPFCIGLGSDAATGWPFTDWMEDMMLRLKGPEVYDAWVNHEIPFDDPDVVEVGQYVYDLWSQPGFVYGGLQNVAATPFADAGLPLLEGDCVLHRQGNFYAANWPDGTVIGEEGDVNAFYLPGSEEHPNITLSGGIYAGAFGDRPEVQAVMEFLASTEYADARAPVGGFLAPNKNTDASLYPTEIEQTFAEILAAADPVRFDASDLMPGAVGTGTFWTAAVSIVTGAQTVEQAFANVEASWP